MGESATRLVSLLASRRPERQNQQIRKGSRTAHARLSYASGWMISIPLKITNYYGNKAAFLFYN
jgi:hypothetical protein